MGPASPCRALDFSDTISGPDVDDDAPLPTWHSSYGNLRDRLGYARRLHGGLRDGQISSLCSALGIPVSVVGPSPRARLMVIQDGEEVDLPAQLTPLPSILVLGPKVLTNVKGSSRLVSPSGHREILCGPPNAIGRVAEQPSP